MSIQQPRKHHYVTAAYLAAWTTDGTKGRPLNIVDKIVKKTWPSVPDAIAYEIDLHMLDLSTIPDENDVMAIERALADVEGPAVERIRRIIGGATPGPDDLAPVFALAATLMVRAPKTLERLTQNLKSGYIRGASDSKAQDALPERLNALIELIMAKHRNESGRPQGQLRNEALAIAFSQVPNYFNVFKHLHWKSVASESGEFVCSDHPVVIRGFLVAPDGDVVPEGSDSKRVFFPIAPTTMLVGYCTGDAPPERLDSEFVASLNAQVIGQAERCVFFRKSFFALSRDNRIEDQDAVVTYLTTK